MSKWQCPDCGGAFPEPINVGSPDETASCPWCGNKINGYPFRE